jgi:ribulose-phosphate 3-epimerase
MSIITPAILATNPEEYKEQVEKIFPFAERVHIDVTDGEFAPNLTLPETQIWWPQEWKVDIHMMVARPSEHIDAIIQLNPNMVVFHSEVEEDLVPIFERLKNETMIKPGLALLRSTVPETVAPAIKAAEHILIFSGNLGEMGGVANMMQLEKIRLIKAINSNVEIGWDGGANLSNVFNLTQSGVDVVNVGAAIMQAQDPEQAYHRMETEINRKGAI